MEMRLKGQVPDNTTASASSAQPNAAQSNPEKDQPADQNRTRDQQQQKYAGSRPGTAKQKQPALVPGALPPTPAGSEGEFKPSVASPSRVVPRPSGAQAELRAGTAANPSSAFGRVQQGTAPGADSDSVKSMSESASFADYVIIPTPDGDREQDA
jgi:hypothetical protein